MITNQETTYQLEFYRYINIILFILSDFSYSITFKTFAPIAADLQKIYQIEPFQINMAAGLMLFLIPIITIPANYLIDKKGPGYAIRIGCFFIILGVWVRLLATKDTFFVILIGQFICGLGGPFIYNSRCALGAAWFQPKNLPAVTQIIGLFGAINVVFGLLIPGLWFSDYDAKEDNADFTKGQNLLQTLLVFDSLVVTCSAGLAFILVRNKPKNSPSYISQIERLDYKQAVKQLFFNNKDYVKLLLTIGLVNGSFAALATTLAFYIEPWGYNQLDASLMGASMIVTGIAGAVVGGYYLKKSKIFKRFTVGCIVCSACCIAVSTVLYEAKSMVLTLIGSAILGFFAFPITPALYEYACELVFPIGEGSAVGFMVASQSILGVILIGLFSLIVDGESKIQSFIATIIMFSAFIVAAILVQSTTEDLKRQKTEEERKSGVEHNSTITNQMHIELCDEKQKESGDIMAFSL